MAPFLDPAEFSLEGGYVVPGHTSRNLDDSIIRVW
jgi:hypothetical protein